MKINLKVNYLSFLILLAGIILISACVPQNAGENVNPNEPEAAVQATPGLQIVLKDFGMPDVWYLQPIINEIQLKNEGGEWITIWSNPEGKVVKLTPDGAETILDTVKVPAGTYVGTRLFVTTMDVGVDVNRDGDISDKNVQTILTIEEFNKLPKKEKPSAPAGGGTPPSPPDKPQAPKHPQKPNPPEGSNPGDPQPSNPSGPGAGGQQPGEPPPPYTIKDGYVYLPEFQDEGHTDTINDYIVPQWGTDFVYDGRGGKIVYDFTLHPLLPRGQHISIEVSTAKTPIMLAPEKNGINITTNSTTVLFDDFNDATKGKGLGTLTYENSMLNSGKAVNLAKGNFIKYSFFPWYKWDGIHNWNRNEAAPGVLTEGSIGMWIKPRQYSRILTFDWYDSESVPQSGYILHLVLNAEGKLTYSVWGGHLDQALIGNTVIPLNKWTHIAVSWGPDGTKLYVNGKLDTSTSANLWPAFSSGKVFAYLNYWGGDDLGLVDDFSILNVATPPTVVLPTGTADVRITSFNCSDDKKNKLGDMFVLRTFASGIAQGPVGARLELPFWISSGDKQTCANWTRTTGMYSTNSGPGSSTCTRKYGQPEMTTWTSEMMQEVTYRGVFKNMTYTVKMYMNKELSPLATDTVVWC